MSDYEVTLVNDNSTYLTHIRCLVLRSRQTPVPNQKKHSQHTELTNRPRQCPSIDRLTLHIPRTSLIPPRQEFFVRFKGPEESRSTGIYCMLCIC